MTDGGALPAWFSRTLAAPAAALAGTVTVGQAFGGDLEAVNVHSGLLAARHVLGADVAVVAQGPGNLGTGTPWGFSGVAAGEAVNAAAVLGGRPVGVAAHLRRRPRGRVTAGVSHHCLTAYGRVALAPADLVVPAGLPARRWPRRSRGPRAALRRAAPDHRGRRRRPGRGAAGLPVKLSTMGRDLDADHAYFLAAAAAGRTPHACSDRERAAREPGREASTARLRSAIEQR